LRIRHPGITSRILNTVVQQLVQGIKYLCVCGILEAGVADPDYLVKVILQALARLLLGYFCSESCATCDKI
jgi:hypothetical protein